jgi:colicin import membrane protein
MHDFWARTRAFGLAIGVHVVVAGVIVFSSMSWEPFRPPDLTGLTIEAVMVDTGAIKQRREEARKEAERLAARQTEEERRAKDLEARREREAEAERQRQKDLAVEKRQEDLRLQRLRAKQEQDRKDRIKKQQDELENVRRQREEAARQRRIEEERLKQLETRRQAEADAQRQAIAEEDMQRQLAAEQAEFKAGRLATLGEQYYLAIQSQVTNNWFRPPTARPGLRCRLKIVQIPGGEVISANIAGSCNGDEATRRSLVAAVERAGSLPYRGFEDVFEREIDFIFRYDGD